MTWDYRVIKKRIKVREMEIYDEYGIHEVYYDQSGHITSWSLEPVSLGYFDELEDIKEDIVLFQEAFSKPTLTLTHEESLTEG